MFVCEGPLEHEIIAKIRSFIGLYIALEAMLSSSTGTYGGSKETLLISKWLQGVL